LFRFWPKYKNKDSELKIRTKKCLVIVDTSAQNPQPNFNTFAPRQHVPFGGLECCRSLQKKKEKKMFVRRRVHRLAVPKVIKDKSGQCSLTVLQHKQTKTSFREKKKISRKNFARSELF
jgi:hypothetical protein